MKDFCTMDTASTVYNIYTYNTERFTFAPKIKSISLAACVKRFKKTSAYEF